MSFFSKVSHQLLELVAQTSSLYHDEMLHLHI